MDNGQMKAELIGEVLSANLISRIERRWDRKDGGRVERAQTIIDKLDNLMEAAREHHFAQSNG